MNTFVHAAAHYAVFVAPVRSGERGQALLASLLVSVHVNAGDARADLRALHRAGAVELIRRDAVDAVAAARSLRARGVPPDVLDRSHLHDEGHTYTALAVTATAATGETIRDHALYCLRSWVVGRVDDAAARLRRACAVALRETDGDGHARQAAREFCALQWNTRAGVLC